MALTQAEVIEALRKTGRLIQVRTLTDWRARHLLPPLKARPLGRGRGTRQVWEDANILDRVAFVFDHYGLPTEKILLALWCCGFGVDADDIRAAWARSIAKFSQRFARQSLDAASAISQAHFDQLEDHFLDLAKKIPRNPLLPAASAIDFAEALATSLFLIFANELPRDTDAEIELLESTFEELHFHKYGERVELHFNRSAVMLLRQLISPIKIKGAIEQASSDDFEVALSVWKTIINGIVVLSGLNISSEFGLTIGRRFQAVFGPPVLGVLLIGIRSPNGAALRELSGLVDRSVGRLETARREGMEAGLEATKAYLSSCDDGFREESKLLWDKFWFGINNK